MLLALGVCFILSGSFVFQVLSVSQNVCSTAGCIQTADRVKRNIDINVNPCEDFYSFACGGYLKKEKIDKDKVRKSSFSTVDDIVQKQLQSVLESPGKPGEPRPFKMARDFYNDCLRQDLIDKRGVGFIVDMVTKAGGWPVLEGDKWDGSNFNWVDTVYMLHDVGLEGEIFSTLISQDYVNSSKYVITIYSPSFELQREYLIQGVENKLVQAYRSYMIDIAHLFGADYNTSVTQLSDALNFEIEISKIVPSQEESRDYFKMYNPINIETMQSRYPIVDWKQYLGRIMNNATQLESNEVIIVNSPSYLDKLQILLQKTDKRTLANYIVWSGIRPIVQYLTTAMRNRQLKYNQVVNGKQEHEPRERECVGITSDNFYLATSAMYVRTFFNEAAKENADDMVEGIRQEMIKVLQSSDWMDEETRERAIEKAKYMQKHIAYPSELLEDAKIEEFYEKLKLIGDQFFEYILSVNRFKDEYIIRKLREPVNKTDWRTHGVVTNVNALYNTVENSIQLFAGILQDVFFTYDRPRYMNYGGIGYAIGHEITHGFDDKGSQFDKSGNLVSWWKPETAVEFKKRVQCVIDQASNYTVESVNMKLNGLNTQGENIADKGGIKLSYRAYTSWVAEHGEEPRLAGLEEYSPRQMFWLSVANVWCTVFREAALKVAITTDVHSPPEYRINGVLHNQEDFSEDFHCPLGSKMNPVQKCNVW